MEEVNTVNEKWDKKRIFLSFAVISLFALFIFLFKNAILAKVHDLFASRASLIKNNKIQDVQGAEAVADKPESDIKPLAGVKNTVSDKLDTIKKEITALSIETIASSSPQVQKIINDLQSLQQYPATQAKEICKEIYKKVCGL